MRPPLTAALARGCRSTSRSPRPVPRTVPAVAALRAAGREDGRVYDDLVVVDEVGRCFGIVRVADLIRSLSG